MADISKITVPGDTQYNIKDSTARSGLSNKMGLVSNPINGNVLITDANGQAQDAGIEPIFYETVLSDVETVGIGLDLDLLWENANPKSDFGAQTVVLNLSNYSAVLIKVIYQTDASEIYFDNIVLKSGIEASVIAAYGSHLSGSVLQRSATVSDNGIIFGTGHVQGSNTTGAKFCVPNKIYGIKEAPSSHASSEQINVAPEHLVPDLTNVLASLSANANFTWTATQDAFLYYDAVSETAWIDGYSGDDAPLNLRRGTNTVKTVYPIKKGQVITHTDYSDGTVRYGKIFGVK